MTSTGDAVAEGLDGRPVEGPGALAPPGHQHGRGLGRDAEGASPGRARRGGDGAAHRPAADQVAPPRPPLQREGQGHAAGQRRGQPVRDPQVGVGLHQEERPARQPRGHRGRAGDVAARAHDDVRPPPAQDARHPRHGQGGLEQGPQVPEAQAAVEAAQADQVLGVPRGGHQLRPGAAAHADHADRGPAGDQGLSQRERRHDVTGGPARGDHHPRPRRGRRGARGGPRRTGVRC